VDHIRFMKRTFKVLQLVGHVNHLKNVLTHIPTPIILGLHQFAHEDAGVSFRGTLEMFFNFIHESLALSTVLGRAPLIAGSMALSIIMNATLLDLSH
jgi:hypothetical protein